MLYGSVVQNGLKCAKTDFRTKVILNYGNAVIRSEAINIILDHFFSAYPQCLPLLCSSHIQQHVCCSSSQVLKSCRGKQLPSPAFFWIMMCTERLTHATACRLQSSRSGKAWVSTSEHPLNSSNCSLPQVCNNSPWVSERAQAATAMTGDTTPVR